MRQSIRSGHMQNVLNMVREVFAKTMLLVRRLVQKKWCKNNTWFALSVTGAEQSHSLDSAPTPAGECRTINPLVIAVTKGLMEDTSSFDQLLAKARDRALPSYQSITRHHFGQLRAFDLYRWHYTDREIAERLGVSLQTATKWREDVCTTLGITQRM